MTHGIRTVGVVGLGTMGAGIAQVVAHHGYGVVACEVSNDLVQAGLARIGAGLGRHVERGRMTAAEREAALAHVAGTTDLDAFGSCDLVVEAIVEDMDAKRQLFARLEKICRPDAILATNTSALSVTEIAAATSTAERVVGMHFFNPAPVLPLVEVIVGDRDVGHAWPSAYGSSRRPSASARSSSGPSRLRREPHPHSTPQRLRAPLRAGRQSLGLTTSTRR